MNNAQNGFRISDAATMSQGGGASITLRDNTSKALRISGMGTFHQGGPCVSCNGSSLVFAGGRLGRALTNPVPTDPAPNQGTVINYN